MLFKKKRDRELENESSNEQKDEANSFIVRTSIEGDIIAGNANITVKDSALVKGDIYANSVDIYGKVIGQIVANRKIILRDGAKINGDIICNSFLVNKGATGQFRISMSHQKTNIKPNREFENLKKREKDIKEKNALTGNISANKKRNEIDYHNESSDDISNRFWD